MYRVTLYIDPDDKIGVVVQANYLDQIITDGQLGIGINVSDKFTFKLYPFADIYNRIQGMISSYKIESEIDGRELSRGHILFAEENYDEIAGFYKVVTCAGELDYLNDSKQPFQKVQNTTPAQDFTNIINIHNQQVSADRQFKVGKVEMANSTDNVYHYVEPGTASLTTISDKLISKSGGELSIRHETDGTYIDWVKEIGIKANQTIDVNTNLQTMERKLDPSKVYSVFYPYGATVEQKNPENETGTDVASPRLTIGTVNGGKDYLERADLIAKFGRISGTKNWDDVHDANILKIKATADFNRYKPVAVGYQLKAIDLKPLGLAVDSFSVGNYHELINDYMGIDEQLRIVAMTLNFDAPETNELTIGDKELTLAEYNKVQKKTTSQISSLRSNIAAQSAKIVTITEEMKTTNAALSSAQQELTSLKDEYDKLIANIGDADFKAIMVKLNELENQTTKILNDLGGVGQSVLDLESFKATQEGINSGQLTTNEQQKTKNDDFEKRIKALENGGK